MTIIIDIASVTKNFFIRVALINYYYYCCLPFIGFLMLQSYEENQIDAIFLPIMFLNSLLCNVTFTIIQHFVSVGFIIVVLSGNDKIEGGTIGSAHQ